MKVQSDNTKGMVKFMRKNYIYAITIVILSLLVWLGYYFYLEFRPTEYKNGTFVELPGEFLCEEWELTA